MIRLIKVVQTDPGDEGARDDLPQLSQSTREFPSVKKHTWKKNSFQLPDAQWPVIASLALTNKQLFDRALETSQVLPLQLFTHIGTAMVIFNLPITHEQYAESCPTQSMCFVPCS